MNDSLVPEWIKRIKAQDGQRAVEVETSTQREALTKKIIQADGPAFWKQLLKDLRITVDSLGEIGLAGSMSDITCSQEEQACQVSVSRRSTFPDITYTNLFYSPGTHVIRSHTSEDEASKLLFCVANDKVFILGPDGHALNTEQTARLVIEPMVNKVRPKN